MSEQASGRFVIIPARAIDDIRLRPAGLRVLCALGTYSNRDGWCWPSIVTLARRLGTTRQAASKQLRNLATLGYVAIDARQRTNGATATNAYRLIFDAELVAIYDRLNPADPASKGGQPDVAGGQPDVAGGATSEVAPIRSERPIRTTHTRSATAARVSANGKQGSLPSEVGERFFRAYPSRRPHSNPKKPALRKLETALRGGADPEAIIRGAENYAALVRREGTDPRYVAQALTWINQERWKDHQEAPEPPSGGRPGIC